MEGEDKKIPVRTIALNLLTFVATAALIFKAVRESNEKEAEGVIEDGKEIKEESESEKEKVEKIEKKIYPINERQYRILAEMEKNGQMEPSEIYAIQPDVSTRTLRRDMDVLVEQGVVKQEGSTKSTKYTYIG